MRKIFFLLILLVLVSPALFAECFSDIRKEAAKHEIYSDKDFELGKILIARMKKMALERKPVFEVPQIMMEGIIYRYARLYFTENIWCDRQLFVDRKLWEKSGSPFKHKSISRTFEIMQDYGVGLSFFNGTYARDIFKCVKKFPEMKVAPTLFIERRPKLTAAYLKQLAESPNTLKINGKAVILTYGCDRKLSPQQFKEYVDSLKKSSGREDFTFIAEFTENCHRKNCNWNYKRVEWPSLLYKRTGQVSARHMLFFFDLLTEYMNNGADGIDLAVYSGEPDMTMSKRTFDELLLPLCGAACAQPGFNGKKALSLQIMFGYASHLGAQTLSANGTLSARTYLELCRKYKVDIPMGFEWDELNESTNWEPTVARPMAMQRLIRYFLDSVGGKKLTPLKGDDLAIPNLLVSHRRQLGLGTDFMIELLNIPDGVSRDKYSCVLELCDQNSKVRWTSPKWEFDAEKLQEHRVTLQTEKYPDAVALVPQLTIYKDGKKQLFDKGLPFTMLRAGFCNDQTWFSTPLRNVLKVDGSVKFAETRKLAPGVTEFDLDVAVSSKEKINVAEAVQNSYSTFAYDAANEYLQNDPDRLLYRISYRYLNKPYKQVIHIAPEVAAAPSVIGFSHGGSPVTVAEKFYGSIPKYKLINGVMLNYQLFSVKKNEIKNAVLLIKGKREAGPTNGAPFHWELPLAKIGEYGVISKVFDDGFCVTVDRLYRHNRLPLNLGLNELKFKNKVVCDTVDGILAVRLISENGRIYWSRPVVPSRAKRSGSVTMTGYSDARGAVKFQVPACRNVDIKYNFTPAYGNVLTCDAGREYYGHAGSFLSTAVGFEGEFASWHTIPFVWLTRPEGKLNPPAPRWVQEKDGSWALDFDGKIGNVLVLPVSAFSQRNGFKMVMEVKPEDIVREQYLIRQYRETYQTGFGILMKNGKLHVTFSRRIIFNNAADSNTNTKKAATGNRKIVKAAAAKANNKKGDVEFPTGIKMKRGQYQRIELSYDGREITISANGITKKFACTGIPLWSTVGNFGGDITTGSKKQPRYFHGRLRLLNIFRI